MAKTRRHYRGKSRKHSSKSVIEASVKGINQIMKPRLKSDFEKMDKSVIKKSVTGLQKKTRGLFSMFGLNKAFTTKNRPGKRVSFYIM